MSFSAVPRNRLYRGITPSVRQAAALAVALNIVDRRPIRQNAIVNAILCRTRQGNKGTSDAARISVSRCAYS
jgi:hypothetical protein